MCCLSIHSQVYNFGDGTAVPMNTPNFHVELHLSDDGTTPDKTITATDLDGLNDPIPGNSYIIVKGKGKDVLLAYWADMLKSPCNHELPVVCRRHWRGCSSWLQI